MSQAPSHVRFPILTHFEISDYQLYPGSPRGTGIDQRVLPGVNLVIGINGLGKTTLLNALFRVMSGPVDWKKRPFDKAAGSTSSELGRWKAPEFFTHRVPDRAEHATISATVAYGDDEVMVTRRLSDLSIAALQLNGEDRATHEDVYRRIVCDLAGVTVFSDFYLILRYLVFFLEDRQEVMWDKTAQSDILRVLFYEPRESEETRRLFDQVQELDSQFRNKRGPYNVAKDRLNQTRIAHDAEPQLKERYRTLLTEIEAYEGREKDAASTLRDLDGEYDRMLRYLEQQRIERAERALEYERLEQRHLGVIFPELNEVAEYVFSHLGSHRGCLVCGNRSARPPARLLRVRETAQCPVCDSAPEQQERVLPPHALEERRLENAYAIVGEFRTNIATATEELSALEVKRQDQLRELSEIRRTIREKREEQAELQRALPPEERDVAALEQFVAQLETELRGIQRQRQHADRRFRDVQRSGEARVQALSDRIKRRFEEYAETFLADECRLEYTHDERKIGQQSARQMFPLFNVKLSSGVYHHTAQPRRQPYEVSESQREFIDLAFRMALITVAAEDGSAMIVLETPEASLDAVFILRAGFLLAEFAASGGGSGNRLIASSNLNRTEMIPALFGYFSPEDRDALPAGNIPLVPVEERPERVVDLLEVAEPNTAMVDHGDSYRRKRYQALHPERFPTEPRVSDGRQ